MSENSAAHTGAHRDITAKSGDVLVSCRGLKKSFGDR